MNILFIGDYRDLNNYGSVATTEALLNILNPLLGNAEIKYITGRQILVGNGVGKNVGSKKTKLYAEVIKKLLVSTGMINMVRNLKSDFAPQMDLPSTYYQFEEYKELILSGRILNEEKKLIEWADVVIINGEGSIVNGTDKNGYYRKSGRYILFLAYISKKLNKKCYILNHTVDPQNHDIKDIIQKIYRNLDGVYVREKKSMQLLEQWNIENASYVPDALWSHDFESDERMKAPVCLQGFDFSSDYICIGDSSGIYNRYGGVQWDVINVYSELIAELRKICPQIVFIDGFGGGNPDINRIIKKNKLKFVCLNNCNSAELYYVLKHSKAYISGRWHTSIISLMAGTPIVMFGSDSHKTEALYDEVEYNCHFFDIKSLPINTINIANEVKRVMEQDMKSVIRNVEMLKRNAQNYSFGDNMK